MASYFIGCILVTLAFLNNACLIFGPFWHYTLIPSACIWLKAREETYFACPMFRLCTECVLARRSGEEIGPGELSSSREERQAS
ncbi:hypothetical protein DFP73DRAFT_563570, partial [Morchella snyderi]